MTEVFANLMLGFSVAATPVNLAFCLAGCILGTLIGVLPGVGPLATFAMILPVTFYLPPTGALIMLAGIYYGAQYGGSTTAILVNIPGEASSVVTCLDGHAMARQGRAGSALSIAALASLFAGCIATLVIAFAGPALARAALLFGPAEYVSVIVVGLVAAVFLSSGSMVKALAMTVLGVFLSLIGTDLNTGDPRYTFGIPQLADGVGFIAVAMGLFGIAEIIANLEQTAGRGTAIAKVERLMPTREDARLAWPAAVRGTLLGSLLGVLPGGGANVSSFAAYTLEKKLARDPSRFGKGAVEGVAGPEAANNAGAQTSFIPMLSLGIPPNGLMAMMIGAMMIHGITPGPRVMTAEPALFWGLIASMFIGNLMLVVLNLPLIGLWVRLLSVRYAYLFPAILIFCAIGAFTASNSAVEVWILFVFSVLGVMFRKFDCPAAPLLLGLVLGRFLEEETRRALLLSDGNWMVFVERPISLAFLACAAVLTVLMVLPAVTAKRKATFVED